MCRRLVGERKKLKGWLDKEGPNGIRYSKAVRKIKLGQRVIQNFEDGPYKVLKRMAVTVSNVNELWKFVEDKLLLEKIGVSNFL